MTIELDHSLVPSRDKHKAARMLAETAPADVPTMMGKGQRERGRISDRALSTPTW